MKTAMTMTHETEPDLAYLAFVRDAGSEYTDDLDPLVVDHEVPEGYDLSAALDLNVVVL